MAGLRKMTHLAAPASSDGTIFAREVGMTEQEQKILEHAKRQHLLRINDTPVAILVDDDDETIVAGCFEAEPNGYFTLTKTEMKVPISIKPIQDETVLGYAHFMLSGILEDIKKKRKTALI